MALLFDGTGRVAGFGITFTGDFEVQLPNIKLGSNTGTILGRAGVSLSLIRWNPTGQVLNFNINGSGFVSLPQYEFSAGDTVTGGVLKRIGSTITLTMGAGSNSQTITGDVAINLWGAANATSDQFTGEMSGVATFIDNGVTVAVHDFDQPAGSTILPDTTANNNDGTLGGFTNGGGFVSLAPPSQITILSPTPFQCKKRSPIGTAEFTVSGTIAEMPLGSTVEYSLDGTTWQTLDASPTDTFSGIVTVTNQQDISVRLSLDTSVTDTAQYVTAAFVILAWWQSNEEGRLVNYQTVGTGLPFKPVMWRGGQFLELADNTSQTNNGGSLWPLIATKYAEDGMPVCVINVAVGGTRIDQWTPTAAVHYPKIVAAITASGVEGVNLSASIGGESDSYVPTSTVDMIARLNETIDKIATDYGCLHYLTYFPAPLANKAQIIAAFDSVVENNPNCRFGGDLSVLNLSTNADPLNDFTHIRIDADAITAANIRYTAFTTASSTLNMSLSGIVDGTYATRVIDADTQALVFFRDVQWVSGAATAILNVELGVNTEYYAIGATEGGLQRGVTV